MPINEKQMMIERLTGVKSSKRNYYTELKKMVEQLEKKNMKLEIINEVTKSFTIDMTMDELLKNIMEKLEKLYTFDRISLTIYEGQQLILTNVYPQDSFFLKVGEVLPNKNSLYYQVIHEKKVLMNDVNGTYGQLSDVEKNTMKLLGIETVVCLPLFRKKQVIGVLSLGSKTRIDYPNDDFSFLEQLADQMAVCMENSSLYNAVLNGKKEWEETFRAVQDLILFVGLDYRIIRFNDSVKAFFQLEDDHLYGRKTYEVIHYQDPIDCPVSESYRTQKTAFRQSRLDHNRICDIYTYPVFNENQEMYGVIIYLKDVTKKLYTEAQLMHSGKLAAIGEMAAGVAHELNSPLTAVIGNSQLLLRDFDEQDPAYNLLKDIHNCGVRSKNIIRNLLTFSRQDEYEFEPCQIKKAVEEVLSLIRYQVERQCVSLRVDLDPSLPMIEGNLQQLEQIVINFILNARDALEETEQLEKEIVIQTGMKQIKNETFVYLSVQDNGVGISEEEINEIFRPFYTTKDALNGTGLGLSVSLGIAKEHGGGIEVNSEKGKGSTFILLVPLKKEGH
ncbi:ATP-binding protein [Alkalihalobacterium chitinilyticum]|uniref:histidine kinase n=1 Tax=Alkalihalobacterium chitinilyticum TaxID=2980103 RepID=A0ABT5VEY4_9BACI|nr:ATP-binding protein [Alkalihalobacterium chitinilyticum]MDE5413820.1 ATP-binding protein [Alkalihalobacterium chitinilyticum]